MSKPKPVTFNVSVISFEGDMAPKVLTFDNAASVTVEKLKEILGANELQLQQGESFETIKSEKDIENLKNGSVLKITKSKKSKDKKDKKDDDKKDKKSKLKLTPSNRSATTESFESKGKGNNIFGVPIEQLVRLMIRH
jgi:hypothetical protein